MASSKPPPPDPAVTQATQANTRIAEAMETRAADNDRYFRSNIAPRLLQSMDEQTAMGRELQDFSIGTAKKYDQRFWDTTAKFQDQVYAAVNAYDTEANRTRIAGAAGADVEREAAAAEGQMARGLQRRGVNPNSGMALAGMRQMTLGKSLAKASAMTMAREAARREGFNLRTQIAGMGQGLTQASQASAQQAAGASGMGMKATNDAAAAFGANDQRWSSMLGGAGSLYGQNAGFGMQRWNAQNAANNANAQGTNQAIGTVVGAVAAMYSDRRLKKNVRRVGTRADGLGVYEFEYVWGGGRRTGLMADEVRQAYPAAVFTVGGYDAVDYSKV